MVRALQSISTRVAAGEIAPGAITPQLIEASLDTSDLPPVDLIIRSSGEQRLSNFLLWQAAYAELWFTPVLWPDFDETVLREAVDAYAVRDRRYGGR
jgi:undecaprenyl diphosphate synthase